MWGFGCLCIAGSSWVLACTVPGLFCSREKRCWSHSGHFITLKTCWLTRYSWIALSKLRDFFASFEPYAISMGLFLDFFSFPLKLTSCWIHTSVLVCLQIWQVCFTVGNSKYKANRFQAFLPPSCEFHVSFLPEMLSEVFGVHPYSLQSIDLPITFQVTFHHLSEALPPWPCKSFLGQGPWWPPLLWGPLVI